jgi:hypothetical protein
MAWLRPAVEKMASAADLIDRNLLAGDYVLEVSLGGVRRRRETLPLFHFLESDIPVRAGSQSLQILFRYPSPAAFQVWRLEDYNAAP